MDEQNRRERYVGSMHQTQENALRLNLDITIMNAFCKYCLSENTSIHLSCMTNLALILNKITEAFFNGNQSLIIRYRFCKDALNTRLNKKISKRDIILHDIRGPIGDRYAELDINGLDELSNTDVLWIEEQISSIMDIVFINNSIIDLSKDCANFINADYKDKLAYANVLKERIAKLNSQFRRNDFDKDGEDTLFKLSSPEASIQRIIDRINSPSYKMITGMQSFNQLLSGGFEGSRVYCFLGLPGEGKTTTLLNILYQLKKYNPNYVCKDKTKRPCIVLLTMENQIHETVCTLYNIACNADDMSDHTTEEIMEIMGNTGLAVTPESPIDIIIKYKPINSVDTNYLFKLTEDLEDDGYEVVAVLQDYVKRIRPVENNDRDERFRLGTVINDFKNFAVAKDIPVITASQMNRDGARIVDDSRASNKSDIIKKIGRTNIGESSQIDENLDATIFLLPEINPMDTEERFMGFKLTKRRFKGEININSAIFYQPFVKGNPVKLAEDVGMIRPISRKSMHDDDLNQSYGASKDRFSVNRRLDDLVDIDSGSNMASSLFGNGIMHNKQPEKKKELIEVVQIVKK